jgi:DNA-binding beta-propeller fold protein YncE
MSRSLLVASFALAAGAMAVPHVAGATGATDCNAPAPDPVVNIPLPGNPFTPVVTPDGCWIFVALGGAPQNGLVRGVAVLHRDGGHIAVVRTVPLRENGTGAALSHDGRTLIVAAATGVAFLDVERLKSGAGDPVTATLQVGDGAGVIYVSTTATDDLLFVALERAEAILVADFAKARNGMPDAVLGRVPVGRSPIAVTLSADERYLYTTSQVALPDWGWPVACALEAKPDDPPSTPKGGIVVIDVAKARTDPAHAVAARVPVGCHPVRLVLAPDGHTAWVSVRGEHSVAAVDTRKLVSDPDHAILAKLRVGTAPVGVAVVDGGKTVISTNSNRFAGGADDRQSLNVIDAASAPASAKLVGTIPAGAFPRELRVTADGHTLLATNFGSRTLEVVDLRRLQAARQP